MPTWLIVVMSILGVYVVGFFAMWAYIHKPVLAALWPAVLVWMLFGNIQ